MKKNPIILGLALLIVPSLSSFAQTFTRISAGDIVNDGGESWGCAWGDYNNDGWLDLFVANQGNFLYRNNGNGSFTKITAGDIVSAGGDFRGAGWGDYNHDGFLDLFVANSGGQNNLLYRNNGDGTFRKIIGGAIATDGGNSRGGAWGDYDNDGLLDLFVANDGNNFLYHNNDNRTFTKITAGDMVNDGRNSFSAGWGDYDNDGRLDLFVTNWGQNNFLYRNLGNGTLITTDAIVNGGGDSAGAGWGDYDNDGDLDLFVANYGQNNLLYQNNGNGTFTGITGSAIVNDGGNSYGSSWGDYDNDGDPDLFVANYGQNNFLYRNNGDGTFTRITGGAIVNDGGNSTGCAWGDYDNDGDLDLFVANFGQDNFLYRNNGNGNNWINIHVVGTVSNLSAIGAKVKVKAAIKDKPVWQMQEISGQTGAFSQNSLNAEFGLAKATIVDSLQIEWPTGAVNVYTRVKVNQFLTIRENNRPRLIDENDIPDTTLSRGSGEVGLDLKAVFRDRDGDTLTYSAGSSHPNIVRASVDGSMLKVSVMSDTTFGKVKITVSADDGRADDGRRNSDFTTFTINRPPFVRQALSDTVLLIDAPRLRINLKGVFRDPEREELELSRKSLDSTIATAVISDKDNLFIYAEGLGKTFINVSAHDERRAEARIQFGLAVIKSPAPDIRHQSIASVKVNQDLPIAAEILDDENAVAFAALKYRAAGSPGFVALLMDSVHGKNNMFGATIPGAAVTERGVEYAIEATDIHRVASKTGTFSVRVRVDDGVRNKRPQPSGGEQKSYHLFSIPLDVDKKSPAEVLLDDLGPYNIKKWRFYDIATDSVTAKVSPIQFPNTADMTPGKAFWLIVKDSDRFINTGPGTTVRTSDPFPIALKKGWNLVGNPYNFPAFAEDTLSDGTHLRFYARESGEWTGAIEPHSREFQPFEGYAVYCSTACTMFVNPNRFSSFDNSLPKAETSPDEEVLWSIRIRAQCQEARDGNNLAVTMKSALHNLDRLDQPEPPVIGEYVSVYFPHRDWQTLTKTYCLDARPEPTDGEIWEFEVKTNIRDKVNLTFEGLDEVPSQLEVWLVDDALQITQNLRESNHYAVAGSEQPKQLKLVVGKRDFVGEKLAEAQAIPTTYELSQNFPNPFNPSTTIRYGLPKAERVTLKIYNLLGEEVVTLVNDEPKAAGYHTAIWDGRNKIGGVVASGIYIYRIRSGSFISTKKLALVK